VLGSSLLEALTTPHPVDRYLELVRPSWSLSEVRAEVIGVSRAAPDAATLTLRPNRNWQGFQPGQHVRLVVEINGVRRTRCYSLACSANESSALEITVKAHPDGEVSNYLNRHARVGMVLGLSQAEGAFVLPQNLPDRLLFISGGSGITPVMSMLRTLCERGYDGEIAFIHYSPTFDDTIYWSELAQIAAHHRNVSLAHVHTRESAGKLTGYFSRDHLLAAAPDYAAADVFVCGPPGLIDSVRSLWSEEQIEERLSSEHFVPPAPGVILGEAKGSVSFARSNIQKDNSGACVLEQAESAGLNPASGCRMGICRTCTCRKRSGSVRNARTGEISTAADEDIQICVSIPVGDVELEL